MSTTQETEARAALTLSSIGTVVSIVATLTVPLYAVGFVALAAQIAATYTGDFSAALYAASLVPDKVIVGQGLRAFWIAPYTAGSFVISVLLLARLYQRPVGAIPVLKAVLFLGDWRTYSTRPLLLARVFYLSVALLFAVLVQGFVMRGDKSLWYVLSLVFVVIVVSQIIRRGRETGAPRVSYYLPSILIGYAGMIAQLLFVTSLAEPPLPHVALQPATNQAAISGRLVTHSDGYWHVLTTDRLVAVRDADVRTATLSP